MNNQLVIKQDNVEFKVSVETSNSNEDMVLVVIESNDVVFNDTSSRVRSFMTKASYEQLVDFFVKQRSLNEA
jgi:hypothetical protein